MPSNPESSGGESRGEKTRVPQMFNKGYVENLLAFHEEGAVLLEKKALGAQRSEVLKSIGVSDQEFVHAYDVMTHNMLSEVQSLLRALNEIDVQGFQTVTPEICVRMKQRIEDGDKGMLPTSELRQYRNVLCEELKRQQKDPDRIIANCHESDDGAHQVLWEDVVVALELLALEGKQKNKVAAVLESEVSERATSLGTLLEKRKNVRTKIFDLLTKDQQSSFDSYATIDAFRGEIMLEEQSQDHQKVPKKIMSLFEKNVFLTHALLHDLRSRLGKRVGEATMDWALNTLLMQKKIALLPASASTGIEEVIVCRDTSIREYASKELESILHPELYNQLGQFISVGVGTHRGGRVTDQFIAENTAVLGIPFVIAKQMLQSFVKRGILKESQSGYSMNKTVLQNAGIGPGVELMRRMDSVGEITKDAMAHGKETAKELLDGLDVGEKTSERVFLGKIAKRYREYWDKRAVKKLTVDLKDKDEVRWMDLSNIQFGHAMLDVEFLQEMKERINTLPPDHVPNVVVVSAVLFGNYQFQKKKRQRLKVASTSEQYDAAKELFEWLKELQKKYGTRIIYNMSDEDELLVEHYAVDTTNRIAQLERERARAAAESGEVLVSGMIPYWRVEQIKQSSLYMHNFELQWDVAFPYSIVTGHRLTSDEYDLLIDTYQKLQRGEEPSDQAKKVLEVDKIPLPGRPLEDQDIIFTDDFEALLKRAGKKSLVIRGSQSGRPTKSSMVQDPMDPLRKVIGHRQSQRKIRARIGKEPRPGENPPDAWAVYDQNVFSAENVGGEYGSLAYSTGTLRRGQMDLSSYGRGVQDDNMWRAILGRKDCVTPSVTTIGFAADGSRYYDIYNETFNALSQTSESPKRTAVVNISDWQVGSITCAADYLVKMLTMALHTLTRTHDEVILLLNGDLFHGHNYKMAAQEGNPFGMPFPRDQQVFVSDMLENILSKLPKELKRKIKVVHITDGNHEWNSGEEKYGNSYLHPVELIFRHHSDHTYDTFYHKYGLERGRGGIVMKGSMMTEKAGAFNVWMRHYLLEKGMKGSGSNPALQGRTLFPSQGNQMENADLIPYSHFHNTRVLSVGDKVVAGNACAAYPSYYESMRAYLSQIGFTYFSVGGGKPVRLTEVTAEALNNYQIPDEAFYSETRLNSEGYYTDKDWDPAHDSLANTMIPVEVRKSHERLVAMGADRVMGKTSALQKRIAAQMHAVMTNPQGRGLPDF